LTLANGERIPMSDMTKLIFEVENLNNASPATVSRCGQIYVSASDLPYESIIEGFLKARKDMNRADEADKLKIYLNKYFVQYKIIENMEKSLKEVF